MTLILVALWAAMGTEATASASAGGSKPSAHGGHRCRCGMDCKARCCCSHEKSAEPSPESDRPKTASLVGSIPGPCWSSAPCGGALPPGSGPIAMMHDPADRTAGVAARPDPSRSLLAPPASDRDEARDGSLIDEPPERLADA